MDKRKKILMIPAARGLAHTMHCACLGQVLQDMEHEKKSIAYSMPPLTSLL